MNVDVLEKIGLSKGEAKIYLTLLELGSVPSGKIVKETDLRKSTVYETIGRLQEKGLVSHVVKKGKKHFEASHPDKILDFVQEKKEALEKKEVEAIKFVDDLKKGYDTLKPHAEAHVLVGIEGFKTMRRDVLRNSKGELLLIGAMSREDEVIPGFFEEWNKERLKKNISMKLLNKESSRKKALAREKMMSKKFEMKFLPKEIESPAVINIYGDRVVNVLWKDKYPLCFMLINKEIADSYKKYFSFLWKNSK